MVPVTCKATSCEYATCVENTGTNTSNSGMKNQVIENMTAHLGGGIHRIINEIQISSKGELASYRCQLLGLPIILDVLNTHPDELLIMPGMKRDLIIKHI